MCEYDRNLLTEVRNTLCEIRGELKQIKELSASSFTYVVHKNNKQAQLNQDVMKYHLELLEDANEGD
jgi:hypothetical protein